jgi:hypothetical protein
MINTSTISAVRFDHEWIKIEIGSFRLCSLDWGHTLSGDVQPGFIATLDSGQTITGRMSEVTGWRRVTPVVDAGTQEIYDEVTALAAENRVQDSAGRLGTVIWWSPTEDLVRIRFDGSRLEKVSKASLHDVGHGLPWKR